MEDLEGKAVQLKSIDPIENIDDEKIISDFTRESMIRAIDENKGIGL